MQHWKTVRIFISSTFRDMHAERDHLVRFVFPELRERCAGRRLHLIDVDLRWGVTEEEAETGQVLEICLDEVERCRPFFVGILGERYGWVPDHYDVSEEPRYDWLRQFGTGHSVTALEIYQGVVRNLEMKGHAFFYFRDPAFVGDVPEPHRADFQPESEQARERLADLKATIRQYYPPFEGYPCAFDVIGEDGRVRLAGLEVFGERVLEDLWSAIAAEYPEDAAPPDEVAIERSYHEAFVESRTQRFVGRADLLAKLVAFADGDAPGPLVVVGQPGGGKSALLARFVREYAERHPSTFVLAHFIGTGPGSADIRRLLLRLIQELARRFGIADAIPDDYEELRRALPAFLEQAAQQARVVLVVDALNQLQEGHHAHWLNWLPSQLPSGVRVVVSTLNGQIFDRLRARRPAPPELEVQGLTRDDGRDIVRQTLWEYRKRLDEQPDNDQLGLLLSKPAAENPLYLVVACEELRVFGSYERVTERIAELAEDVPGLFAQALERLEGDHGRDLIASALSMIACTREGLLEDEILELLRQEDETQLPRVAWARLYRGLRPYLRPAGEAGQGLLDFFHQQLGEAARLRYLTTGEAEPATHGRLAALFRRRADPSGDATWRGAEPRAFAELPYHLGNVGDPAGLEGVLCDLAFIEAKCTAGLARDLVRDYRPGPAVGAIAEFARFVRSQAHVLASKPHLTFQQAALEPAGTASAEAAEARWLAGAVDRPWFKPINRPSRDRACLMTLTGHSGSVQACTFSPDGGRIVSASDDETLKLWDAVTGEELATLAGHSDRVRACAFSRDGGRIVSASDDKTLKLWDAATGEEIKTLRGHSRSVFACAFSPDGGRIVSASDDKTLKLWDATTGGEIKTLSGHTGGVHACAISPDGARIVSASRDTTLKLWDAATGEEIGTLTGHSAWVTACAISPDGGRIVSGSRDMKLKLWDKATGEEIKTLRGDSGGVLACAFSPDSGRIVSAFRDKTVKLWDAATGDELTTLVGHLDVVLICAFSPDGARIISASADNTLKLWDATTGEELYTLIGHSDRVTRFAFSPDGVRIVSASADRTLKVWDAATGEGLKTLSGHLDTVEACLFSPDGHTIVSASEDKTVKLWDTTTGEEIRTLAGHSGSVKTCAFSPDGGRIVSASQDKTVKLWDAATGEEIKTLPGQPNNRVCAFSADGAQIVSASYEGTLMLWDVATGRLVAECDLGTTVFAVAWFPGSRLLATGDDFGTVRITTLEGLPALPPIVTAWRSPRSEIAMGCPHCRTWSRVLREALGTVHPCPACRGPVQFNRFTIDSDWRPIAAAWAGRPQR